PHSMATVTATGGDDSDFVNLAEWLSNSTDDFGHTGEELVQNGGLIVFVEGGGFNLHGIGFGFTFGADDFGFGETTGTDNLSVSETTSAVSFGFGKTTGFVSFGITDTTGFGGIS